MATGLDYSAGRIPGATIRAAGHTFAVRYCGTPGRTKNVIRSEFDDLVRNGVTCWLVYENDTNDSMGGYAGGVAAARAARADANALGYPAGGVIFFCADRHLSANEIPISLLYLDGAASVLGWGAVGAYGFSEYINAAKAGRRAAYFWQCGSRSTVGPGVHIYQRNNETTTIRGINCDINDLLIPIGPAAAPPAQEDDLTPEQDAILRRIDNELLGPWKDGRPSGWGTAVGPRTVVAMLVELTNELLAKQRSRYPGSTVELSAVDAIRDDNGLLFQLPALIAGASKEDPKAIAEALRPVLASVIGPIAHDAVKEALGEDNAVQADAIVTAMAKRLALTPKEN